MEGDPFAPATTSPSTSPTGLRARPRRPRIDEKLTQFSFVSAYSVVEKDANPLITGNLSQYEADGPSAKEDRSKQLLHLDLYDLVKAKKSFEEDGVEGSTGKDLTLDQFVAAFSGLVGSEMKSQLGYLFMKIDCDCDGHVSWDELLTFVMSQNRNVSSSDLVDRQYVRVDIPDCPGNEAHRDVATMTIFLPKVGTYVSAGRDGTLRAWSAQLRHEVTIPVSERGLTGVNDMCLLPGSLAKLAVAGADRVLTFYETADLVGAPRWSVHGRVQLKDMPISLTSWVHEADSAHCFAVGTDAGSIAIYDAKRLMSLLKDDRVKSEAVRGLIPAIVVARALILTLPLHKDWVTNIMYEDGLGALVSASLDSYLHVTQLDWPANAVPTAAARLDGGEGGGLAVADPAHCRNMCTIKAHAKGVTCVQLMHVSSRKLCATSAYERHVCIWNIETGDLLKTLEGHRGLLRQLTYDPHSQILISLGSDGEVRFWDMGTYTQLQIIKPTNPLDQIASIRFNPHHSALVSTTRRLGLWQHPRKTATDEVLAATLLAPQGHQHPLVAVLYSASFFLVVTGDESGAICVWDVRTGVQVFRFELGGRLTSMSLDVTGRKLITGGVDGTVTLWNFSSGERLKIVSADEPEYPELEVSGLAHIQLAKLTYFVSVGWQSDGAADIWMWPDRHKSQGMNQPRRLPGHTDDILAVAFCPPNLLCTGAYDGVVLVHNCESAALHRRVQIVTPTMAVESLAVLDRERRVLPDSVLVAGAADGWMRLWSVRTMTLLAEVQVCTAEGEGLQDVCCEPSATLLLCGDSNGRLHVYDASDLSTYWLAWQAQGSVVNEHSGAPVLESASVLQPLYTWRAHTRAITRLAYLTGVEGVLSSSTDCTVRLWTLSGEQVGVFGQPSPWALEARRSWFDPSCHALDGEGHDRVKESERRLEDMLPHAQERYLEHMLPHAQASQKKDLFAQRRDAAAKKPQIYRMPAEQLARLSKSIEELGVKPGDRSAAMAEALVGESADAPATSGMDYHRLRKGTLWANPAAPPMPPLQAPLGALRPSTSQPQLSWVSSAGNKRPTRVNVPQPRSAVKLAPLGGAPGERQIGP